MIHVLTYPDRWIDKLRYQLFGTFPVLSGDEPRYGPGWVEVATLATNSAKVVPSNKVAMISFDGGYREELEKTRAEAARNAMSQFNTFVPVEDHDEARGDNVPYVAANAPRLGDTGITYDRPGLRDETESHSVLDCGIQEGWQGHSISFFSGLESCNKNGGSR